MCGYNRVNGNYSCANTETLNTILKDELAFPGYVVSDFYAVQSTDFANGGLDMEMPGNQTGGRPWYYGDSLVAAVNNGSVPLDRLTDMAIRIMTPYYLLGQDQDFPTVDPSTGVTFASFILGYNSAQAAAYPAVEA